MPMTGTWRFSFSLESTVNNGEINYAYLYHNGEYMPESEHFTFSGSDWVVSTGGREILMTAQQGDTLTLRSGGLDHGFYNILTCFVYNAV